MKTIFFPKAGKLMLTKYVSGALTRNSTNSYSRNGAVQSIQQQISFKNTDLPDGNGDFPAASPKTGVDGSVVINLSFMPIELYAFLMGTTVDALVNTQMWDNDYEIFIPETSPYQVTLPHAPALGTTIMLDVNASAWTKTASVSAVPATTQYTISAAAAIFNSADAGKSVFLTYDWTALTAVESGVPKTGSNYVFEAVISGEAVGEDESTTYDTNVVIDRCQVTGNINPPEQAREPKPWNFTLKVLKPRGTKRAVAVKAAPRS